MSVEIQEAICLDAGSTPAVSIWRFQSFAVDAKILFKLGFWHFLFAENFPELKSNRGQYRGQYRGQKSI